MNMPNVVLTNDLYKPYLKDFSYLITPITDDLEILYKGFEYDSICRVLGYLTMSSDSKYTLNVPPALVDVALEIKSLPQNDKSLISELFEYLQYDCPRKVVKKYIPEKIF